MFEVALEARIRALPEIASTTGLSISWGRRLPGLPALSLEVVADPRPQHFKGFQSVRATLVQIDVLAKTPDQARALREALIRGLVDPDATSTVRFRRSEVTGVRTTTAEQQGADNRIRPEVHHHSIDIRFWHNG